MAAIFILLLNGYSGLWIDQTGIFKAYGPHIVQVSEQGHVFIKDYSNHVVLLYNQHGEFVSKIGGPGQGPGDLEYIENLQVYRDQLIVVDGRGVSLFSLDGTFQKQLPHPTTKPGDLFRVTNGWVFLPMARFESSTFPVLHFSIDLTEKRELLMLSPLEAPYRLRTLEQGRHAGKRPFNPISERNRLYLNRAGTRAYFREPGRFSIFVYDFENQDIVFHYAPKTNPVPFDETWADKQLEQIETRVKQQFPDHPGYFRAYPEFAPPVRQIMVGVHDVLLIEKFTPSGGHYTYEFLDNNFQKIAAPYSPKTFLRLIAIKDGFGYLVCFEDEEFGIAKVSINQLDDFVKAHPIQPEGCKDC